MKMKSIIALAAIAVAAVASASTNYAARVARDSNPAFVYREMAHDSELAKPEVFRAALEDIDRTVSTGKVEIAYRGLTRWLPLTARAYFANCDIFTKKAGEDALAVCGYDAENRSVELAPGETGYANFALQAACTGDTAPDTVRNGILTVAVVPARRKVRAEGGSFVGKEGAKRVKAKLDELAAELNAPRFGRAGELLASLGVPVEWEFIQGRMLSDSEVEAVKRRLMDGEIQFTTVLQNKLCVALGVADYNSFVREYNGK